MEDRIGATGELLDAESLTFAPPVLFGRYIEDKLVNRSFMAPTGPSITQGNH